MACQSWRPTGAPVVGGMLSSWVLYEGGSSCPAQVSKAHAMLDEARLLVERRVPPALAQRCEEVHAAGGLSSPPPGALPDVLPPAMATKTQHEPVGRQVGWPSRQVPPRLTSVSSKSSICTCQHVTRAPGAIGNLLFLRVHDWHRQSHTTAPMQKFCACAKTCTSL